MAAISGQKTVTTAGTAEALGSQVINGPLMVKALDTNAGIAAIGNDGAGDVTTSNGMRLEGGDARSPPRTRPWPRRGFGLQPELERAGGVVRPQRQRRPSPVGRQGALDVQDGAGGDHLLRRRRRRRGRRGLAGSHVGGDVGLLPWDGASVYPGREDGELLDFLLELLGLGPAGRGLPSGDGLLELAVVRWSVGLPLWVRSAAALCESRQVHDEGASPRLRLGLTNLPVQPDRDASKQQPDGSFLLLPGSLAHNCVQVGDPGQDRFQRVVRSPKLPLQLLDLSIR